MLTAETLRTDLLDLWQARTLNTRGIIIVSHNIEEAVLLADRIVVLGSNPGRIVESLEVGLRRPRDRDSAPFRALVDHVYGLMTRREKALPIAAASNQEYGELAYPLPDAQVSQITGFLVALAGEPFNGRADLPMLSDQVGLPVDDLFEILEALEILGFAHVTHGNVEITPVGTSLCRADILRQKEIFAAQLVERVPLSGHIRQSLEARSTGRQPLDDFLGPLKNVLGEAEARRVLATAIEWGRYAELFAFDHAANELSLENPGTG